MRLRLIIAGTISLLTCMVHLFAGGPEILEPMLQSNLAEIPKTTSHVVWHITTIILLFNGVALLMAAVYQTGNWQMSLWISLQNLAIALVFLAIGIQEFGTALTLPQWVAFSLIGLLAFPGSLGTRNENHA